MRHLLIAAGSLAVLAALVPAATAAAATSPYPPGAFGTDVAIWQCGSAPDASFTVVAVNNGRPFSVNPCLARQAPGGDGGAYMNTGFDAAYLDRVSGGCAERAMLAGLTGPEAGAYGVGCSEAEASWAAAIGAGFAPIAWWLDVETANSWSDSIQLNRAALQGATDYLAAVGGTVGLYSTPRQLRVVAGEGWSPKGAGAFWLAGASGPEDAFRRCQRSVNGLPVWLVQYVAHGTDVDVACGVEPARQ